MKSDLFLFLFFQSISLLSFVHFLMIRVIISNIFSLIYLSPTHSHFETRNFLIPDTTHVLVSERDSVIPLFRHSVIHSPAQPCQSRNDDDGDKD